MTDSEHGGSPASPARSPLPANHPLSRLRAALDGRYEVDRELGRGGMATVYLAHELKHGREVAVKVLHPELASVVASGRFLLEIRTVARLVHPHILTLFDSGEADGLLYYTMPYVAGESLADRLSRGGPLPIAEAIAIAREVADALAYAHQRGVIHRDIKPANILLASHDHACIADFGLAHALSTSSSQRLTASGHTLGSPLYMAPEQIKGSRSIDGRADLYGLGCVLYEMLTGEAPYTGYSLEDVLMQHLTQPAPKARAKRADAPAELQEIVTRAMAKTPEGRFQTALDMVASLRHVAASAPGDRSNIFSRLKRAWTIGLHAALMVGGS